jgi:hypothetical protein
MSTLGATATGETTTAVTEEKTTGGETVDTTVETDADTGGDDTTETTETTADTTTAVPGDKGEADKGDKTPPDADAWRKLIAGDNGDILKELSRIKTATDLGKLLIDQKKALSKRAEAPKLPDNATPKQVAEYRKVMGIPEVAEGAKPEDFAKAYGIDAPKGYEVSEVEKAMLADFAQVMHGKHTPAGIVKEAADFFFKAQTANQQNLNVLDVTRQKEWTSTLKTELGKDYEPMLAAGEAYLNQEFADNAEAKGELLNARLPGGGRLGDNPWFIKKVIDAALNNGFADRIEANEMEQGGKTLAAQQAELEKLQQTDKSKYDLPETQKKLSRVIELRLARGEIDEMGNPVKKRRSA